MDIFEKWNKELGAEDMAKSIKELKENGNSGDYEDVPVGTYEVSIDKMELVTCRSEKNEGKPMIVIQFRILEGKFKNSCLFMNQLVHLDWQINMVNNFLHSLKAMDEIEFTGNFRDYRDTIADIMEVVDGNLEFLLEYSQTKKDFPVYKIKEVYEK